MTNIEKIQKYYKDKSLFTSNQYEAVISSYTGDNNILLSAGAGCGKTYVLSKRVLYLLETTDLTIDNFLILTFTDNSANEMKARIKNTIKQEIEDNPVELDASIINKLKEEYSKVDSASISTFDSFANKLVKKYAAKLNIPSDFSIVDDSIINYKFKEIATIKILKEFDKQDSPIKTLYFDRRTERDISSFINLLLAINKKKDYILDIDKYFKDILNKPEFTKENYQNELKIYFKNQLDKIEQNLIKQYQKIILNGDSDLLNKLSEMINHYKEKKDNKVTPFKYDLTTFNGRNELLKDIFEVNDNEINVKKLFKINTKGDESYSYTNKKVSKVKGEERETFKFDDEKTLINLLYLIPSYESYKSIKNVNKNLTKYLYELYKEISYEIEQFKQNIGGYKFSDISNSALKLLNNNEDIRQELRKKYKSIMVDEYQDSNFLQEDLLKILSTSESNYKQGKYFDIKNLFMVGDIKQSIYRFRGAVPDLFKDKLENPSKYFVKVITMNDNFRSSKEVIDQVNTVFNESMSIDVGGINYDSTCELISKNSSYNNKIDLNDVLLSYYMNLDKVIDEEDFKKLKLGTKNNARTLINAELIAKTIDETIKNHVLLPNGKTVNYGSFALLFQASTKKDVYIKALNKYKIPYSLEMDEDLGTSDTTVSLTNLILAELLVLKSNNLNQKEKILIKKYLISIERSFILNMYDDEIYEDIENKNQYSNLTAYKKLIEFNSTYRINLTTNIKEIFNNLIQYFDVFVKLSSLTESNSAYNQYIDFASTIDNLNKFGFNQNDVYKYFEHVKTATNDSNTSTKKTKIYQSSINTVKLTTIHKSKGLEYDITFIPELNGKVIKGDIQQIYFLDVDILYPYFPNDSLYEFNKLDSSTLYNDKNNRELLGKYKLIKSKSPDIIYDSLLNPFINVEIENYKAKGEKEELSESERLMYVALTRAKFKNIYYYFEDLHRYINNDPSKSLNINAKSAKSYGELIVDKRALSFYKEFDYKKLPLDIGTEFKIDAKPSFNNDVSNLNVEIYPKIDNSKYKKVVAGKRASIEHMEFKDNSYAVNQGLKMHAYLESIDYSNFPNIDLSFIQNSREKDLIEKFIGFLNNLLKSSKINNPSFYQEFNYYDNQTGHFGSVDFYIDSLNKGIIIDYKLKNIDNEGYINQLNNYRRNISEIFNKPINKISCYLYSIFDGAFQEFKIDE